MSTWTPELKQSVIDKYTEAEPTAENTIEIIQQIAEELKQSVNGIRMILIQAGVYVKKDAATTKADAAGTATKKTKTEGGESTGTKRVSKESQIEALKKVIEDAGKDVDEDILSKLTGKAAAYFTGIISGSK
jgi:H2-forming N5,N10-methylenetetrahydromethanopterin dehydrogenase-like enzyme